MSDLAARLRACRKNLTDSVILFPGCATTTALLDEAADRIDELEDRLATIRSWHLNDIDARLCDLCGAGGGRWPCDTLREIDDLLIDKLGGEPT